MNTTETIALVLSLASAGLGVWVAVLYSRVTHHRIKSIESKKHSRAIKSQLDQSEATVQAVFDSLPASVFIVGEDRRIVKTNAAGIKRFGDFTNEHIIKATLSIELSDAAEQVIKSQIQQTIEFEQGPERRTMKGTVAALGKGALCIVEDVGHVKRLESARRDFVANVSHELRTPLTSIRAMAETLLDGARKDDSVADRYLGTILSESDRLSRITEDLLVLSRAESREPERTVFDLGKLAALVTHRFQAQSSNAGVQLTCSVEEGVNVHADQDQIVQAIVNLVDNGLKYTPQDGRVDVSVKRVDGTAVLSVADTGAGIAHADISRIFERFYRVDKARSRRSGGTGLGLSIVKHVAEGNAGRVDVVSELNHGSTFSLILPTSDGSPAQLE